MLNVKQRRGTNRVPDAALLRPADGGKEERPLLLAAPTPRELGEPFLVQGEGFALLGLGHLRRQLGLEIVEVVRLVVGLEDGSGEWFHDLASFRRVLRATSRPRMRATMSSRRTITSGLIDASRGA